MKTLVRISSLDNSAVRYGISERAELRSLVLKFSGRTRILQKAALWTINLEKAKLNFCVLEKLL